MPKAALQRIELHLGRTPEFPEGSESRGYVILAPLTAEGRLDAAAWKADKAACRVRRFWAGLPDRSGHLVHRGRGDDWRIDYDSQSGDDDAPGYRLGEHIFAPGEYVTFGEGGRQQSFRVASVRDAAADEKP